MRPTPPRQLDLIGLTDLPQLLGIAPQTARQWRTRGVLPQPQAVVSSTPVWERATIIEWALGTRRIGSIRARELRAAARVGADA